VLVGGGEDEEALLLDSHHHLRLAGGVVALQVVDLALSEDESFSLDCAFLEGDAFGHVLDVLHDEVDRHSVVPETRNYYICVDCSRQDEVAEGLLHEFVVLVQHADHATATLSSISLQPSAETDVVYVRGYVPSQLMKIL
jgi:hypothetical protein